MYCAKCDESIPGYDLILDEQGYEHPFDRQICADCRYDLIGDNNVLTDEQISYILGE